MDGKYGILLLWQESTKSAWSGLLRKEWGECAVVRGNGKYGSRVESYALEDQLLTISRVLLAGADMAEKYSLCLYV